MKIKEKIVDTFIAIPAMGAFVAIFISLFGGTFMAVAKGCEAIMENDVEKTISKQIGQEIGDIKEIKVVKEDKGGKILLICEKKDKQFLVEYRLSEVEYVAMQHEKGTTIEYVYHYVVPYKTPSFSGNKQEYQKYLSQNDNYIEENIEK